MDLSSIGISTVATEVYRHFLRRPGSEVTSAGKELGLADDEAEQAVDTLDRLALLDVSDRHRVTAMLPRAGLERLIERRVEELNGEIRKVLAARDAISCFEEDQRQASGAELVLGIERVAGLERVRQRIGDLALLAYQETLCLHPGGPLSEAAVDTGRVLDERSLRRGVRIRSVYHPRALEDPRMLAYLHDLVRFGGEVRITEAPMDRMIIFDREVAVVPVNPKDSARGALLVREAGLVSQLLGYFEGLWEDAMPMTRFTEPARGPRPLLTGLERRVLEALASSDKDEIAAREIDVSVRTYRRYVAELMARLGAVNRFQAALRAKEEGWI